MSRVTKQYLQTRRKIRVKASLTCSTERPRLSVFRSNTHTYGQIIDDITGTTLVSASDLQIELSGTKTERARQVGIRLGQLAREKGIKQVAFDRSGYAYHGRVAALADGARSEGLSF